MKRALLFALTASLTACIDFDESLAVCRDAGRCPPEDGVDAGPRDDDAGVIDAGTRDSGLDDAGSPDASVDDAGAPDAGVDAGQPDGGGPDAGQLDAGAQAAHCLGNLCFEHPFPTGASWNYLYPVSTDEAWVNSSFGVFGHYKNGHMDFEQRSDRLATCGAPSADGGMWFVDDGDYVTPPSGQPRQLPAPYFTCIDAQEFGGKLFIFASTTMVNDQPRVLEYLGGTTVTTRAALDETVRWFHRGDDGGEYLLTDSHFYRVHLEGLADGGVLEQLDVTGPWTRPGWVDSNGLVWLSDGTRISRQQTDGGNLVSAMADVAWLVGLGDTAWGIRTGGNGYAYFTCRTPMDCAQDRVADTEQIFAWMTGGGAVWASGPGGSIQRGLDATTGLVELFPSTRGTIRDLRVEADGGGWAMDSDGRLLRRVGTTWTPSPQTYNDMTGRFSRLSSGQLYFAGKTSGAPVLAKVEEGTASLTFSTTIPTPQDLIYLSGDYFIDSAGVVFGWDPSGSFWSQQDTYSNGTPTAFYAARRDGGFEAWLGIVDDTDGGGRLIHRELDGGWNDLNLPLKYAPNDLTMTTTGLLWVLDGDGDTLIHLDDAGIVDAEGGFGNANAFRLVPLSDGGLVMPALSGYCEVRQTQPGVFTCPGTKMPVTYLLSGSSVGDALFLGGSAGSILRR